MSAEQKKWAYEPPTRWIHRRAVAHKPDPKVMGDSGPWIKYVTAMWQALADPTGGHGYPPAPKESDLGWPPYAASAYWAPLPHLLRHSFGWRSPVSDPSGEDRDPTYMARGLGRLLDAGNHGTRHDDVRVRFLLEAWGEEHLAAFAAWASGSDPEVLGPPSPAVRALVEGGRDPLHLSAHWDSPIEAVPAGDHTSQPAEPTVLLDDMGGQRHGLLLLDNYAAWSTQLHETGRHLDPGPWAIDVVVKPVGWLGTFHQSSDTGIWFSGDLALHLLGQ